MAVKAARTRSRASPTALSGRPTTKNPGNPAEICTCTATGTASMPQNANDRMDARLKTTNVFLVLFLQKKNKCFLFET
jgi:hypothetical protein